VTEIEKYEVPAGDHCNDPDNPYLTELTDISVKDVLLAANTFKDILDKEEEESESEEEEEEEDA